MFYITKNLFETNKTYLMNCMRIPALQSLLLYARTLDTNAECTRIICDEWLEIRFLDQETAQAIISAVLKLRTSIEKLLNNKLDGRILQCCFLGPSIVYYHQVLIINNDVIKRKFTR